MSRRRKIEQHRRSLDEIRDIMSSMKTLAYVANRKLTRLMQTQARIVAGIEEAAADFLHFYPLLAPSAPAGADVVVLLGSERGFCGDLNHALLRRLQAETAAATAPPLLLAVGHKLHIALEDDARVAARIDGASTPDEVPDVLARIVDALGRLQASRGSFSLSALYHASEQQIELTALLPPFSGIRQPPPPPSGNPPLLNLAAQDLFAQLTDRYLFAVLHRLLFAALWSENYRRMTHLDGAVKRLEDVSAELKHRSNVVRQEEIIEEIEVILLNASESAAG
jgi:F-type H+-transporting ATPase subunit gamma